MTLVGLGLWALYQLERPLDRLDVALIATLTALAVGAFTVPPVADFFLLDVPPARYAWCIAGAIIAGGSLIGVGLRWVQIRWPEATVRNGVRTALTARSSHVSER
jgi:hypothetical protein